MIFYMKIALVFFLHIFLSLSLSLTLFKFPVASVKYERPFVFDARYR